MAGEPTLYHGNESADGWVEYLQTLLLEKSQWSGLGSHDFKKGLFDDFTFEAVKAFQSAKKLKIDGIVGDQTWAALQGEPPPFPAPHDDGRKPGTYVERGIELRFTDWVIYSDYNDEVTIGAASVGDEQPELGTVDPLVTITRPDGTSDYFGVKHEVNESGHFFSATGVTGGVAGTYKLKAELPDPTGGDIIEREFTRS
jgi:hypothetical protein